MANNQTGAPTNTFVTPGVTFGTSLEYQLLGTYSTTPFMQICNDVAARCHCNLTFLPDLCKPTDPMQAHFHIAYAQFDMVGPSDIDRTSLAHQLNILIVQNKTADFVRSAAPLRQIDLFENSQIEDDSDEDACFLLNVSGHFLQRWDLQDITCLLYIFTEKDKDLPVFTEHFHQVIPYFDVNLTSRIFNQMPDKEETATSSKNKTQKTTPKQFLHGIAISAQRNIMLDLMPRSPIFPQKSLLS
jgi:hypothetical protein